LIQGSDGTYSAINNNDPTFKLYDTTNLMVLSATDITFNGESVVTDINTALNGIASNSIAITAIQGRITGLTYAGSISTFANELDILVGGVRTIINASGITFNDTTVQSTAFTNAKSTQIATNASNITTLQSVTTGLTNTASVSTFSNELDVLVSGVRTKINASGITFNDTTVQSTAWTSANATALSTATSNIATLTANTNGITSSGGHTVVAQPLWVSYSSNTMAVQADKIIFPDATQQSTAFTTVDNTNLTNAINYPYNNTVWGSTLQQVPNNAFTGFGVTTTEWTVMIVRKNTTFSKFRVPFKAPGDTGILNVACILIDTTGVILQSTSITGQSVAAGYVNFPLSPSWSLVAGTTYYIGLAITGGYTSVQPTIAGFGNPSVIPNMYTFNGNGLGGIEAFWTNSQVTTIGASIPAIQTGANGSANVDHQLWLGLVV
jgi:hypothetical protein